MFSRQFDFTISEQALSATNSPSTDIQNELRELTATIVAAYVTRNTVEDLPALIRTVYTALAAQGQPEPAPPELVPAVPIKRSVFPDYIVCLEDGKKLKMLKRHLQTRYNLTPDEYRAKWGLPQGYPLVAPNYAERRSELARTIGLGRKIKVQASQAQTDLLSTGSAAMQPPAKRRGRRARAA